jgi:DNA-binding MarR family transcriptional regulator
MMPTFAFGPDGLAYEPEARAVAEQAQNLVPSADKLAMEVSYMAYRLHNMVKRSLESMEAECGISRARFGVLRVLASAGSGLTMNEIARQLIVTPTNVTRHIVALAEDGLVERAVDPDDRRSVIVYMTVAGRRRFEQVMPERVRRAEEEFSSLSEREKRMLIHIVAKLRMASPLNSAPTESEFDEEVAQQPSSR